jgi:hypothetical protein
MEFLYSAGKNMYLGEGLLVVMAERADQLYSKLTLA